MRDYTRRFLIALNMALCIGLLFLGGKHPQAQSVNISEMTAHWIWPSNGVITDVFGTRNGEHKGIDIAAGAGSPIYAVDEGVVSKSYYSQSYGHVIFVKHNNNLETVYAHMKTRNVTEGQTVAQGEIIGSMGNTGDSSGVHLHFEIHEQEWTFEKQNALNPMLALGDVDIGKAITASPNVKALEVSSSLKSVEMDTTVPTKIQEKEKQSNRYKEHVVQPGETLWSIAQKYGITVQMLASMNQIKGNKIMQNQRLKITNEGNKKYIVQSGDTLMAISRKTNASVEELKQWNRLKSDIIVPQQILIVQK